MERIWKSLTVVVVVAFLVAIPKTSLAEEGEKECGFVTRLSTWNPIKDNFSKPLMENIPNFEIQGFIQNITSMSIYKNVNEGRNLASTDTAFQRIEWLFELEPRYMPTPNIQLLAKIEWLYNTAYDWDGGFADGYGTSERRLNKYRRPIEFLREWYADYINGPVQVRVGRQQVVWGRVDGRQILDFIHGLDYTRWPAGISANPFVAFEQVRIPKFMTNIQYFPGDFQFQFLWIPDFEASWGPGFLNRYPYEFNPAPSAAASPIVRTTTTVKGPDPPARNWENSELGFMAKVIKEGWDLSAHYFWGFNNLPTVFIDTVTTMPRGAPSPANPILVNVLVDPLFKRVHRFGLGADKTWSMLGRQWAVKLEGRYSRNLFFATTDANPSLRGQKKADSLLTGIQIETYIFTNMGLILRWDHEQIFKYSQDLRTLTVQRQLRPSQDGVFFTVRKPIRATYDRLVLQNLLVYFDNGQWRLEPTMTYELTEDFKLMLGGHFFWGAPDEIYGQFARHDGIDFGVRWSF